MDTYRITKQDTPIYKSEPRPGKTSQQAILLKLWPVLGLWNGIGVFIRSKPMAMRVAPSFTELRKYWGLKRALDRVSYGMDIIITDGRAIFWRVRRSVRRGAQEWRLFGWLTSIRQFGRNHPSATTVGISQFRRSRKWKPVTDECASREGERVRALMLNHDKDLCQSRMVHGSLNPYESASPCQVSSCDIAMVIRRPATVNIQGLQF